MIKLLSKTGNFRADAVRLHFCYGVAAVLTSAVLAGCGTAPKAPVVTEQSKTTGNNAANSASARPGSAAIAQLPKASSGRGGYYKDDGPGENPPPDLESTVDPIPVVEAFSRSGNKPYAVFGKTYTPLTDNTTALKQRGTASWYGKKFHGQKTSSGELYDMYKMTAAHPTLPIPSYARVTNIDNGKQVIVRINDRGPFHSSRIIDLSYTAALKLGYLGKGSGQMEVERLLPEDIAKMAENRQNQLLPLAATVVIAREANESKNLPERRGNMPKPVPERHSEQTTLDELIAMQENKPAEKGQPERAAANTALATSVATSVAAPGFYIQLGAYAIRANAESTMSRLKTQLEHRLPDFDIVQKGALYRLIIGPFSSRTEATSAIAQHSDLGGAKALVVLR
ncbi:septal ring lytic transglycosylase RlpA family protein [soil metagenome]